jgi:hypothetical protein
VPKAVSDRHEQAKSPCGRERSQAVHQLRDLASRESAQILASGDRDHLVIEA